MPMIVFWVHMINWYSLLIIPTEDEIILGSIYPDIRISKEEISVMCLTVRGTSISSKTEENYDEICSGCEDVWVHQLDIR